MTNTDDHSPPPALVTDQDARRFLNDEGIVAPKVIERIIATAARDAKFAKAKEEDRPDTFALSVYAQASAWKQGR